MKLIMENWRQFLVEVSYELAQKSLDSKKTHRKLDIKGDASKLAIFKKNILDIIPADDEDDESDEYKLKDGEKGTALLWLLRLAKNNSEFRDALLGRPDHPSDERSGLLYSDQTHRYNIEYDVRYFFRYQKFMEIKDLNAIKSLDELKQVVDDAEGKVEEYKKSKEEEDAGKGTKVLEHPNEEDWFIALALNLGAACKLGRGQGWCTGAKDSPHHFKSYSKPDDPLIFLQDKKTDKRYQAHYGKNEFMGKGNEDLSPEFVYKLHKLISQAKVDGIPMPEKYPKIKQKNYILMSNSSDPQELLILAKKITDPEDEHFKAMDRLQQRGDAETVARIALAGSVEGIFKNLVENEYTDSQTLELLFNKVEELGFPVAPGRGGDLQRFIAHKNTSFPILSAMAHDSWRSHRQWVASSPAV